MRGSGVPSDAWAAVAKPVRGSGGIEFGGDLLSIVEDAGPPAGLGMAPASSAQWQAESAVRGVEDLLTCLPVREEEHEKWTDGRWKGSGNNAQTSCIFLVIVSRKQRTKSKIKNKDQAKAFEVSIDVVPECVCILLNGPPIELCIQFYTTKSIHQIPSCQRLSIKAYRKEIKQIKKVLHKQCLHILESDLKYGSPIHIAVTPAHSNRCYYLTKA